jgi:hypothetical protein
MAHENRIAQPDTSTQDLSPSLESDYELGLISHAEAQMGIHPGVSLAAKGNTALLHTVYKEAVGTAAEAEVETDPLTAESIRLAEKHGGHPDDYDWRAQ